MKRAWSLFLPLLAVDCTVDTPVAERSDDVVSGLEMWCEAECIELTECEIVDVPARCVENCVTYFNEAFEDKGEVCENAGSNLMSCVRRYSCEPFTFHLSCGLSAEDLRCVTYDARVFCDTSRTGPPIGLPDAGPPPCELRMEDCSNGSEYLLTCFGDGDSAECECTTDGATTSIFWPSRGECPDADGARICGWPVVSAAQPWSDLPVTCEMHLGTVGDNRGVVSDCEISFESCSDGSTYEIECGSLEDAECTCTIDGETVSTFEPMNAVCPYALDPDGGVAALNYACGFNLAPPEEQP